MDGGAENGEAGGRAVLRSWKLRAICLCCVKFEQPVRHLHEDRWLKIEELEILAQDFCYCLTNSLLLQF